MRFRVALPALALIVVSNGSASAQTQVVVQGRVVERGTATPVVNASVELDGYPGTSTSSDGTFRFESVALGGYSLRVGALGYSPVDEFVVIGSDTTLVVELDIAPLDLDTLDVDARRFELRGEVRERGSDQRLAGADVITNVNRETRTSVTGRFRLRDMPAGFPFLLRVRAFGYMPLDSAMIADEDTSVTLDLEVDSLVQRMIDVEVARLEERARPFRTAVMPAIDREELLRRRNRTVLDVVEFQYGIHLRRVQCIMIDDEQRFNGLEELATIFPGELERIEVLERGAMLRIYTREFMKKMLGGGMHLAKPVYVDYGRTPYCQ
jgi:hypothetical protein